MPQSGQSTTVEKLHSHLQVPPEQTSSLAQLFGHEIVPPQPLGTEPHSLAVQLCGVRAMQQVPPEHAPPAQLFGHVIVPPQPSASIPHCVAVQSATFFGAQQVLVASHTPVSQSPSAVQVSMAPHLGQSPPPQSTSVSLPFFALSVQVATSPGVPPASTVPLAASVLASEPPIIPMPESVGITGGGGVGALPNDPVPDGDAPDAPPEPPVVLLAWVPPCTPLVAPLSRSPADCVAPCAHAESKRSPHHPTKNPGAHRPTGCHPVRVMGSTV